MSLMQEKMVFSYQLKMQFMKYYLQLQTLTHAVKLGFELDQTGFMMV